MQGRIPEEIDLVVVESVRIAGLRLGVDLIAMENLLPSCWPPPAAETDAASSGVLGRWCGSRLTRKAARFC